MKGHCAALSTTDSAPFSITLILWIHLYRKCRFLHPLVSYNKTMQKEEQKCSGLMKINILRKFRKHKLCTLVPKWTIVLMVHCSSFDFDVVRIPSQKATKEGKGFFDLQFQITVHPLSGSQGRISKPDIHNEEQRGIDAWVLSWLLVASSLLSSGPA